MDLDEILRVVGALYLGLYLRAEILQRENASLGILNGQLKAEIEELKKKYETEDKNEQPKELIEEA